MRMEKRIGMAVAILVGLIGPADRTNAGYIDAYHVADFTGQLSSGPNIRAPFNSVLSPGGQVTGSFVYDDALIPSSGSGLVNVFFSSFPDTTATPAAILFKLDLGGGITFDLSHANSGAAAIQYNNGAFNGFFFDANFTFQGNQYDLNVQGGVFSVRLVDPSTGFPTGQNLVNGTLNIGNANLTNVRTFEPTIVPEPSALASLAIAGVATLGLARRRHGRAAA